jgi:acyl-CoA synthetase (AMP-forming)/AMP-acid ligase II
MCNIAAISLLDAECRVRVRGIDLPFTTPGVKRICSVPDDRLGQVGKAFVVPLHSAEGTVSEDDVTAFLEALPRNGMGKARKDQLR